MVKRVVVFLLFAGVFLHTQAQEGCAERKNACCKPKAPEHGKVLVPETPIIGAVALFECNLNYRISHDLGGNRFRSLICSSGNVWNQDFPTCEKYACETPEIANGSLSGNPKLVGVGAFATVLCKPNFVPDGPTAIRCGAGNEWDSEFPNCRPVYWDWCLKPEHPESGAVAVPEKTPPGGLATFSCKPGYTLYGATQVTCDKGNWKWSGDLPYCSNRGPLQKNLRPGYSLPQKYPDKGATTTTPNPTTTTKTTIETTTTATTTTTTPTTTTTINRQWRDPVRSGNSCNEPYIENGQALYSSLVIGTRAVFVCDDGYRRRGPKILRCNANRSWVGGRTPLCV